MINEKIANEYFVYINELDVQKIVGHKSPQTTANYNLDNPKHKRKVMNRAHPLLASKQEPEKPAIVETNEYTGFMEKLKALTS